MKWLGLVLCYIGSMVSCVASPIMIGNGPFGILTSTSLLVPSNAKPSELLTSSNHYQQDFDITVTGSSGDGSNSATGLGDLIFSGLLQATSFNGVSASGEHIQSWASITAPFYASTTGYIPQGSTGGSCMNCTLGFTFGVTERVTFIADTFASYVLSSIGQTQQQTQQAQQQTSLAGSTIQSLVLLYLPLRVYSYTARGDIVDATVVFDSVPSHAEVTQIPEPTSFSYLFVGIGLGILICTVVLIFQNRKR